VLAERQLLMDHPDAGAERVARARETHEATVEPELARVGGVDARQQLAERALPRSVLSAQRVAGAARDLEADVAERAHAWKALADPAECHDGRVRRARRVGRFRHAAPYFSFRYSS